MFTFLSIEKKYYSAYLENTGTNLIFKHSLIAFNYFNFINEKLSISDQFNQYFPWKLINERRDGKCMSIIIRWKFIDHNNSNYCSISGIYRSTTSGTWDVFTKRPKKWKFHVSYYHLFYTFTQLQSTRDMLLKIEDDFPYTVS